MPRYFKNFTRCDITESELKPAPHERAPEQSPDALPFDALSPRRFEILCYRLKKAQYPASEIDLTQGAGDGGKDVVVYTDGQIAEVTQCKNLRDRLTKPQLLDELGKLALCFCREPDLFESKVRYEIWCPGGLAKTSAEIILTWPKRWTESDVAPRIKGLLKLPGFSDLDWPRTRARILHDFPRVVTPVKKDGIDISLFVRSQRQIYDDFFLVRRDASLEDIRRVMAEPGWRQMTASDLQHVADRVGSFNESERLYLGFGYALGLKSDIITLMTPAERDEFFKVTLTSSMAVAGIVLQVGIRKATSMVLACAEAGDFPKPDKALLPAAVQFVTFWACARFWSIAMPKGLERSKAWNEYRALPFKDQAQLVAQSMWQICSEEAAKNAALTEVRSQRQQTVSDIVASFKSSDVFTKHTVECLASNQQRIVAITRELDELLPKQLMIISDSVTFLDGDAALVKRFASTMDILSPSSAPHMRR